MFNGFFSKDEFAVRSAHADSGADNGSPTLPTTAMIEAIVNRIVDARERERINDAYRIWMARSPGDRLTDDEIARYSSDRISGYELPVDVLHDDAKLSEIVTASLQGQIVPLIETIIANDPSVKTVVNIGSYAGTTDYYLSKRHPGVEFFGVDFFANILDATADLKADNLRFQQGYALDIIEAGEPCDIAVFSSTATRIKTAELKRYFRMLAKLGSYIVINEPLYVVPGLGIVSPETLPADEPMPHYLGAIYAGDRFGGYPPCVSHNYRALLEGDFEILHNHIMSMAGGKHGRVHIVARSRSRVA